VEYPDEWITGSSPYTVSLLGGTPEEYATCAAKIREEYADIGEASFLEGRRQVPCCRRPTLKGPTWAAVT
jgi:hypothetical protein